MQEKYIEKETAKLAKEKRMDEPALVIYYDPPKIRRGISTILGPGWGRYYNFYNNQPKDGSERIHGFSQTLVQKWLREKHNIFVIVELRHPLDKIQFDCVIGILKDNKIHYVYASNDFDTCEEALEIGLQEALKLIK